MHERRQRRLRDDLGDDEYERLVDEGHQMRLEEGIELALYELDEEPS